MKSTNYLFLLGLCISGLMLLNLMDEIDSEQLTQEQTCSNESSTVELITTNISNEECNSTSSDSEN